MFSVVFCVQVKQLTNKLEESWININGTFHQELNGVEVVFLSKVCGCFYLMVWFWFDFYLFVVVVVVCSILSLFVYFLCYGGRGDQIQTTILRQLGRQIFILV